MDWSAFENSPLEFREKLAAAYDKCVADGEWTIDENGNEVVTEEQLEKFERELQEERDQIKLNQINSEDDLTLQEQIILSSMLYGKDDQTARWAQFRQAIGLYPHDPIPEFLWTDATRKRIALEIDAIFRGEISDVKIINKGALIEGYRQRIENGQVLGSLTEFSMAVAELAKYMPEGTQTLNSYAIAVDLLKSKVARRKLKEIRTQIDFMLRADRPVENTAKYLFEEGGALVGFLKGRLRDKETFVEVKESDDFLAKQNNKDRSIIYRTGIRAFDMDQHGGVAPGDTGKLNVIGGRPAVGKTTFSCSACMGLTLNGAHTLFISAELTTLQIMARLLSRFSYSVGSKVPQWIIEGKGSEKARESYKERLEELCLNIKNETDFGRLHVKGDFQPTCEDVAEYIYAAKARDPKISAVFVDHFHNLTTMKGFGNERQELEFRAQTLIKAAKQNDVDIFVAAQLNRNTVDAKIPGIEHIVGTDMLAQLATNVWCIEMEKAEDGSFVKKGRNIFHAKTRNGQNEVRGTEAGRFIYEPVTNVSVDFEYCYITDGTDY